MENFNKVFNINYKNEKFIVLEHSIHRYYYFLKEKENNTYEYPTYEEFISLNNMIINNRMKLYIVDKKNDQNSYENKIFKIVPKIIYKGTTYVLTIAMVIYLLTSCVGKDVIPDISDETMSDLSNGITTEVITEAKKEVEPQLYYPSGNIEASKYLEFKDISYEDLIECAKSNSNIPEKYQQWIIEDIRLLEKAMPNLCLDVFYENLRRINIIALDHEVYENEKDIPPNSLGYFYVIKDIIYIKDDPEYVDKEFRFVFRHELFGHATNNVFICDQKNNTVINSAISTLYNSKKSEGNSALNYKTNINYIGEIGNCFTEAIAELINSNISSNDGILRPTCYSHQCQALYYILNSLDMSLEQFCNEGTTGLINRACSKGINIFPIIMNLDKGYEAVYKQEGKIEDSKYSIIENLEQYTYEYYNALINKGLSSQEAINKILELGKKMESSFDFDETVFNLEINNLVSNWVAKIKNNINPNTGKVKSGLTSIEIDPNEFTKKTSLTTTTVFNNKVSPTIPRPPKKIGNVRHGYNPNGKNGSLGYNGRR